MIGFSETKLIRCVQGRVYDVAIDIRRGSSTFLQYFGVDLKTYKSDSCGWTVVSDTPDSMVQGSILTDRLKFT